MCHCKLYCLHTICKTFGLLQHPIWAMESLSARSIQTFVLMKNSPELSLAHLRVGVLVVWFEPCSDDSAAFEDRNADLISITIDWSWLDGIPQKEAIEEDWKRELFRRSSARETRQRHLAIKLCHLTSRICDKELRMAREFMWDYFKLLCSLKIRNLPIMRAEGSKHLRIVNMESLRRRLASLRRRCLFLTCKWNLSEGAWYPWEGSTLYLCTTCK